MVEAGSADTSSPERALSRQDEVCDGRLGGGDAAGEIASLSAVPRAPLPGKAPAGPATGGNPIGIGGWNSMTIGGGISMGIYTGKSMVINYTESAGD